MNILLVKYQYLEAQISGKFVKQEKVGEYLVFSLFSYRHQRPPPLSLSNHYHLLFCKRGLGKPQNFIFWLPNSNSSKLISWQEKTPQKCWDGMQRKLHILQQRWEAKEGKIIASWGENLFWFGWQISFWKMGIVFLGSSIFSVNFHFPKSVYFLSSSFAAAGLFPCTWNVWVWWWGKRGWKNDRKERKIERRLSLFPAFL